MDESRANSLIERLREHAGRFDHRTTYPTIALAGAELCREAADAIEALGATIGAADAIISRLPKAETQEPVRGASPIAEPVRQEMKKRRGAYPRESDSLE